MINQLFIKAKIKCLSPISIGSGESDFTDNDVLVDAKGLPYIPGAALAGVCRHYLSENGKENLDDVKNLFGKDDKKEMSDSRIIFYNAECKAENYSILRRDGVKIDEVKSVAEDHCKFDYEVIDFSENTATDFEIRIEIEAYNKEKDGKLLSDIIQGANCGLIRLGGKANRGFGKLKVETVEYLEVTDINNLISFQWSNSFKPYNIQQPQNAENVIQKKYKIKSFVTVANPASLIGKKSASGDAEGVINSEALKNENKKPVVPGTSWAGVFRHHFRKILIETNYFDATKNQTEVVKFLDRVFGSTDNTSMLVFDETEIDGAHCMCVTRNAVDRFTGAACDKKLFTNQLAFGGTLNLSVTIKNGLDEKDLSLTKNLLELTFADLYDGSLNVGGLGGVGGGMLGLCEEE